jgi:general secretion pathway protein M
MRDLQASFSRQVAVSVAALVALVLTVVIWSVAYLTEMRDLQTEYDIKSQSLDTLKYQTIPKLPGGGNVSRSPARAAVIAAPTETIAASELQKAVLDLLERAGGVVHTIQAEATSDVTGDGLRRLNTQMTFDSSMDALQKVLFDLETAIPFVFVDSVLVQPTATAAPAAKIGETLRVTLVASSYWKGLDTSPGKQP